MKQFGYVSRTHTANTGWSLAKTVPTTIVFILVAFVIALFIQWYGGRTRKHNFLSDRKCNVYLEKIDDELDGLEKDDFGTPLYVSYCSDMSDNPNKHKKKRKYIAYCLALAQSKWPWLNESPANYQMVWKFLAAEMEAHGVRPSHMADMLPVVVELTFRPSRGLLQAQELRAAMKFVERVRDAHAGVLALDGTLPSRAAR